MNATGQLTRPCRLLLPAILISTLLIAGCDKSVEGEDTEFHVGCDAAHQTRIFVPPRATFLRVSDRDHQAAAVNSVPHRLSNLGIQPGDRLRLERFGEFQYNMTHPDRVYYGLLVLFSSTNQLLPYNEQHRVPGALAAGEPFVTRPTYHDDLATDIPEDFVVGIQRVGGDPRIPHNQPVFVTVPEGAEWLFLSPEDDHFSDNIDEDEDFSLCVEVVP
jgi:hypothetical protein